MEEQISTLQKTINTIVEFCVNYSFQVVGALIVLIIGVALSNWIASIVFKMMQKKNLDVTLSKFLSGVVKIIVLGFAILIALGKFGITITPFVAALSAVALGASFAIKGPLSNYGAGLSIILSRPFVVGNTIRVRDVSGVVDEVQLAFTKLIDEDGVEIKIPNNQVTGEILFNSKENKVVEGVIGISYSSDPEQAISLIKAQLEKFSEITKTPMPVVGIQQFGDSSVNLGYRYWVLTKKYFQVSFAVNLAIYKAFKQARIEIPFPQREIKMIQETVKTS